jgi:hypothetical protein
MVSFTSGDLAMIFTKSVIEFKLVVCLLASKSWYQPKTSAGW